MWYISVNQPERLNICFDRNYFDQFTQQHINPAYVVYCIWCLFLFWIDTNAVRLTDDKKFALWYLTLLINRDISENGCYETYCKWKQQHRKHKTNALVLCFPLYSPRDQHNAVHYCEVKGEGNMEKSYKWKPLKIVTHICILSPESIIYRTTLGCNYCCRLLGYVSTGFAHPPFSFAK